MSATTMPWVLRVAGKPLALPIDHGGRFSTRLISLNQPTTKALAEEDLMVVPPDSFVGAAEALDEAAQFIHFEADLEKVVRCCVQEIVLLRAPEDSFDVSHSEPRWPTRIFISVPAPSIVRGLRVAEAIVHEAMHLNLTFLEGRTDLVCETKFLYSPWKEEPRPASGVLHGLYVFACIYRFCECLLRLALVDGRQRNHLEQRLSEIREEVASLERDQLFQCLTPAGGALAGSLFAAVDG